jgi:hypothetical protein
VIIIFDKKFKAIGDAIGLSVLTRKHFKTIGLIEDDTMSSG